MRQIARLNRSPLSPLILFPLLWVAGALLSQIHLLNIQTGWSWTMTLVVAAVPLAFIAGGLIGSGIGAISSLDVSRLVGRPSERTVRLLLLGCVVIGFLELAHQFVKIGGIPLIASDGNVIRFAQGGPTVILINLLTVAGLVGFVRPRNILAKNARFDLFLAFAAMFGFALQAGRGSLALMIVVAVAARWLYWGRPKTWLIFGAGLSAFVILSFGFYLRARQVPLPPFEAELFGEVLPGTPFFMRPLLPVYVAVVTNFYALQGLVAEFPNVLPYGGGSYNAIGLDLFIPGTENISTLSANLTAPWVTSTVAGSLWADGGFPVVLIGVAITGVISVGAFTMAMKTRALGWCLLAAYLLYVTIFGLYTNLWTQQIDWLMVSPLLLLLGFAIDPGRTTGARAASPSTTISPVDEKSKEPSIPARTWIAFGAGIIGVLLLTGFLVQKLVPTPVGSEGSAVLPGTVMAPADVISNGDSPSDNEPLYWTSRNGSRQVSLYSRAPLASGAGRELTSFALPDPGGTTFDVAGWRDPGEPALFAFRQERSSLLIRIKPADGNRGDPLRFRAGVAAPSPDTFNTYAVATWTGPRPDLFVVTRGSTKDRVRLRILSGESGFRSSLVDTKLPITGLAADDWTVDVGNVSRNSGETTKEQRPDLVLVRHDPDTEHVGVQLVTGEEMFNDLVLQRDIDVDSEIEPGTGFVLGFFESWPSMNVIETDGEETDRVSVFSLRDLVPLPEVDE